MLVAGFPGTRAGLWQQVGRAGRGGQDALGVLVARDDPLDTYLVTHPEALIRRARSRPCVFDPDNPYVLGPHLCAAAAEVPLTESDLDLFGPLRPGRRRRAHRGRDAAAPEHGLVLDGPGPRASDLADIRSSGGAPVRLVEAETGRLLGTVDQARAHGTVHAGAVYLHQGETYLVERLDLDERRRDRGARRRPTTPPGPRRHRHRDHSPSASTSGWGSGRV